MGRDSVSAEGVLGPVLSEGVDIGTFVVTARLPSKWFTIWWGFSDL